MHPRTTVASKSASCSCQPRASRALARRPWGTMVECKHARTPALSSNVRDAVRHRTSATCPPRFSTSSSRVPFSSTIPAGSVAHRALEAGEYLELVITGVIRVFVTAPDGRTMTIRYCRCGRAAGRHVAVLGRVHRAGDEAGARGHAAADDVSVEGPRPRAARPAGCAGAAGRAERAAHGLRQRDPRDRVRDGSSTRRAPAPRPRSTDHATAAIRTASSRFGSRSRIWPTPSARCARSWSARCDSSATPAPCGRSETGSSCSTQPS